MVFGLPGIHEEIFKSEFLFAEQVHYTMSSS